MRAGSKGSAVGGQLADWAWLMARALRRAVFVTLPVSLHFAVADLRFRLNGAPASRTVSANIRSTFGGENESSVERIVYNHARFQQASQVWKGLVRHPGFDPKERWPLEGKERLENAISKGSGVVLATAHLGFAAMLPRILRAHGYASKRVVAELPRRHEARQRVDAWLAGTTRWKRWLYEATEVYAEPQGPDDLVAGLDIRPVLSALAAKQTLVILGDGLRATGFVRLELLGRPYPFPTGFVKIALLTGAEMLPIFAIPDENGRRICTRIGQRLELNPSRPVVENLEMFASQLDAQLRQTPHLWSRWTIPDWFNRALEWAEQTDKDPFKTMPSWMKYAGPGDGSPGHEE